MMVGAGSFRMVRRSVLAVALALAGTSAFAQSDVPVLVGGSSDFDACGASGVVDGLDPNGDDFLSVRAGPSSKAREGDRLNEGDIVHICDQVGKWIGIVYGNGTCGVTAPIVRRKPYRGGCKSGWVYGPYVRVQAG